MIKNFEREKLLHAIVFFVENTKKCGTLKLFKLLNFLDFEHYRQAGRPVTGLRYFAWKQGPVPSFLWHEITKEPKEDLKSAVEVTHKIDHLTSAVKGRDFVPKVKFDQRHFTPRELKIMHWLADVFSEASADDMSQFSHRKDGPWAKVFKEQNNGPLPIPYELSIESPPIIGDMKTLPPEELEYRRAALVGESE